MRNTLEFGMEYNTRRYIHANQRTNMEPLCSGEAKDLARQVLLVLACVGLLVERDAVVPAHVPPQVLRDVVWPVAGCEPGRSRRGQDAKSKK